MKTVPNNQNDAAVVALRIVKKRIRQMREAGENDLRILSRMIDYIIPQLLEGKPVEELWELVEEDDDNE